MDCAMTAKGARFCTCDGTNGTACPLWAFRFGRRPATVRRGPDARFLDPDAMPPASVPLERCR